MLERRVEYNPETKVATEIWTDNNPNGPIILNMPDGYSINAPAANPNITPGVKIIKVGGESEYNSDLTITAPQSSFEQSPQRHAITAAQAVLHFRIAAAQRMAGPGGDAVTPEEWAEIARQAFETAAADIEHARPALEPGASLLEHHTLGDETMPPSTMDLQRTLGPGVKILSRSEIETVARNVKENDPDDLDEFLAEVLDRLFGKSA